MNSLEQFTRTEFLSTVLILSNMIKNPGSQIQNIYSMSFNIVFCVAFGPSY